MMPRLLIALILAAAGFALAALVALQPDRPPVIPGTLHSTWKTAR